MKNIFISYLTASALAMICPDAHGTHIGPDEALLRLANSNTARSHSLNAANFTHVYTGPRQGIYIFNLEGGGFIVTAADDRCDAPLAYGDKGEFDPSTASPAMMDLLECYDSRTASGWILATTAMLPEQEITPLVSAKWDQNEPYNLLTPVIGDTHTLTGCVATAMAQVLRTLRYPESATGSISYEWRTGGTTLSHDFDGRRFDYSNMSDCYGQESSSTECRAVAELMYACGMGVKMDYSDVFSGAVDIDAAIALERHFGFSAGLDLRYRDFYRIGQWIDMIHEELSAGRPVLYYGFSPLGGHAFICDGYRNDGGEAYFHFNWGWSGISDGYFHVNLLNPEYIGNGAEATGFNREQSAIFGLIPAADDPDARPTEKMLCFGMFAPGKTDYTRNSNLQFGISSGLIRAGFFNMSTAELDVTPGILLRPSSGEEDIYIAATQSFSVAPGESIGSFSVRGPEMPATGSYQVIPAWRSGEGKWSEMPQQFYMKSTVKLTCSEAGFSIEAIDDSDAVTVERLEISDNVLENGHDTEISAYCVSHNLSDEPTTIVPVILNASGSIICQLSSQTVTVPDSEPFEVSWNETIQLPQSGNYSVGIVNGKFILISDIVPLTVINSEEETIIDISDPRINRSRVDTESTYNLTEDAISFTFKASCRSGYYDGDLTAAIIDEESIPVKLMDDIKPVTIAPGETLSLAIRGNAQGLSGSGTYRLTVYSISGTVTGAVGDAYPLHVASGSTTGIDCDGESSSEFFDTKGMPVTTPRRGEIVIKRHKGSCAKSMISR